MVPWVVLVSALVVSVAAEVVLLLVAAAEVLAGAEAVAEAVAEADALADAEGLEVDPPELPPQAARPRAPAMVRDRTAIDFFTVVSLFCMRRSATAQCVVWLTCTRACPVYAFMLAPRPGSSLRWCAVSHPPLLSLVFSALLVFSVQLGRRKTPRTHHV